MVQTRQLIGKNWHYILGIVLMIIIVINTLSLLSVLAEQQDPVEYPHNESSYYINPIPLLSYDSFDYFNDSLYFYSYNNSLVQLTFNDKFTDFQTVKLTQLIPIPSDSGWRPIDKITTNGKRFFGLYDLGSNYSIFELINPYANKTYVGGNFINITCQTTKFFSAVANRCEFRDIKLLGDILFVLKFYLNNQNELLGYNITSKSVEYDYPIANAIDYMNINQGETKQELLLGGFENGLYSFMRFDLNTGFTKVKISGIPYNQPYYNGIKIRSVLLINSYPVSFLYNTNSGYLLYFTKYTLQAETYLSELFTDLLVYFVIITIVILIRFRKFFSKELSRL